MWAMVIQPSGFVGDRSWSHSHPYQAHWNWQMVKRWVFLCWWRIHRSAWLGKSVELDQLCRCITWTNLSWWKIKCACLPSLIHESQMRPFVLHAWVTFETSNAWKAKLRRKACIEPAISPTDVKEDRIAHTGCNPQCWINHVNFIRCGQMWSPVIGLWIVPYHAFGCIF